MTQTDFVLGGILASFILYVLMKGELGTYLGFLGTSGTAASQGEESVGSETIPSGGTNSLFGPIGSMSTGDGGDTDNPLLNPNLGMGNFGGINLNH